MILWAAPAPSISPALPPASCYPVWAGAQVLCRGAHWLPDSARSGLSRLTGRRWKPGSKVSLTVSPQGPGPFLPFMWLSAPALQLLCPPRLWHLSLLQPPCCLSTPASHGRRCLRSKKLKTEDSLMPQWRSFCAETSM